MSEYSEPSISHFLSAILIGLAACGFYVQFGFSIAEKAQEPQGSLIIAIGLTALTVVNIIRLSKND